MTDKFRYGIIGAGSMGREHIRNVNIIDNAEIVALADPFQDSLEQSLSLLDRKSTRLNSSHSQQSRMPSSA